MSDGNRRFTITMTLAQYDVLMAAVNHVIKDWTVKNHPNRRDVETLKRAVAHLSKEFESGVKG